MQAANGAFRGAPSPATPRFFAVQPRYDYPLTQTRRAVKALLLLAAITFLVVTVVMAVVFRDQRSRNRLRFMRNVGWGYVIAILLLAAWRIYAGGL